MTKHIELATPGEMLKADFLDDMDIKPGTFARKIGVDNKAIKDIIDGKRKITAEMALRFGLFFGMSAHFWLNLQKDYDLRLARKNRLKEFEKIVEPYESALA